MCQEEETPVLQKGDLPDSEKRSGSSIQESLFLRCEYFLSPGEGEGSHHSGSKFKSQSLSSYLNRTQLRAEGQWGWDAVSKSHFNVRFNQSFAVRL